MAKKSAGRPTVYTEALGVLICERIAAGDSLRRACRDESMPAESTVRSWVIDPQHPISAQYGLARAKKYELWADEILDIADDGTNDWTTRPAGDGSTKEVLDAEHVQRSRLRIDSRKWLLSKLLPKNYGDKVELSGADGGPIQHSVRLEFVKPDA